MAGWQQVVWIGNLGQDPELRHTQSGHAVLTLRVACTETYLDRNKQKQEHTEWMSCSVWGKRATALARFLSKGQKVTVIGKLRSSKYTDRDGVERQNFEIKANEVVLGTTARGAGGGGAASSTTGPADYDDYGPDDDIPF